MVPIRTAVMSAALMRGFAPVGRAGSGRWRHVSSAVPPLGKSLSPVPLIVNKRESPGSVPIAARSIEVAKLGPVKVKQVSTPFPESFWASTYVLISYEPGGNVNVITCCAGAGE